MLLACSYTKAQDIHFSQVDVNPILYNPAYAGFFDGKGRFGVVYRNQWASVSDPFSTFAATAEVALLPGRYRRNGLNIGTFLYRDKAGTLSYGTTVGNVALSYYQALNYTNTSLLSIAVSGGVGQQGFNLAEADFGGDNETMAHPKVLYPSFGLGVAWFYQPSPAVVIRTAFAVANLNEPNISYLGMGDATLHRRYVGYARMECGLSESWTLMPIVATQLQHHYAELLYGVDLKWRYSHSTTHPLDYSAGVAIRHGDAVIVNMAAYYSNFTVSLSYDANISPLVAASRSIGAVEVALVYHISKQKQKAKIPCATF